MYKFKRFCLPICLVMLGIGILWFGSWDMHRAAASIQPEAWYQGTDLPMPDAFYGSAHCPNDPDSFYVVAGWQSWFINRDEVWRYDADTNTWTELAPYPENMGVPSVTCYQGYLYSAGGSPDTPGTSDHFYRYEIDTNIWTQLSDLPRTQNGAALAAWDGYLYMIGGDDAPAVPLTPTTQVDRYNLQAGIWETNWGMPMPEATIADWLQSGQYVYFVGGFTSAFPINSDATMRYDLATDTWGVGPSYTSRRAMGALAITSQYLYAIGGDANGGSSSDGTDLVERLDLSAWPIGSWQNISDPLPEPRGANAGFCSDAVTGGEIWSVGGLDLAENPTTGIFYRPSEPCVSFGVDLADVGGGLGDAGTTVEYWLTITNTGVVTDYFTLEVSTTWNTVTPMGGPGPIGPGERMPIAIDVEIPPEALPGDQGLTEITATSMSNLDAIDTTSIITLVGLRDFNLQPISPDSQKGHPGEVLTFTLQVSNIGDFKDSYNVEISATWQTTATLAVGPLLPGEEAELLVLVTIPPDAAQGDWDDALVTLTSQIKPSLSHAVKLTSTTVWHRMLLPLAYKN
jgi:hypothetical protein